jgi:hypothetical protein
MPSVVFRNIKNVVEVVGNIGTRLLKDIKQPNNDTQGFGHGGQAVMIPLQRLERQQSRILYYALIVTLTAGSV